MKLGNTFSERLIASMNADSKRNQVRKTIVDYDGLMLHPAALATAPIGSSTPTHKRIFLFWALKILSLAVLIYYCCSLTASSKFNAWGNKN